MDNAVNKSMTFINPQIYLSLLIIVFNVLTEPICLCIRGQRDGGMGEWLRPTKMQGSGRNISACKIIQESDKVAM